MPSMQTSDVTYERLQHLATVEAPHGARVLSMYLNLDPQSNFAAPANRRSAVTSLVDGAARAVEGEEDLGHDAHVALRADVTRARDALAANLDDDWAEGAHALALFVSGPVDLFDVVKLPRPVGNEVFIAERPAVARAAETGPVERWAVLVMDGDDARLFEGLGDRLVEIEREEHERAHGSGRAARQAVHGDRPVDKEELVFLRELARRFQQHDRDRNWRRILLGCTERHCTVFKSELEQHTREKCIGRFDAGADWENAQAIRQKVEPLLLRDETRREADVLAKARYPGVRGLTDTLPALYERRVDTLVLEPGREHAGVVCPRCRWALAEERGTCPVDGETMRPHSNIFEWAIEVALEQDAVVLPIRHHNDLAEYDGIGAALRF